jgi:MFS family permease
MIVSDPHADLPLPSRARQRLIVAVLAFAGASASFQQTILIPIQGALPELLNASPDDTAWVITVTLLVSAVCTPIAGRLGDMFGKRRIAIVLLGLLIAGSVVAALSPTVVPLIIGRALQGTGLGVIPLGIALLRDSIDPSRLGSSIALVSATLGVGGALGLPISAFVSENADFRLLFWAAAGTGAITLVLVFLVVPERGTPQGGAIDVGGVAGLTIGLVALLLGISRGNTWGWTSAVTLSLLIGGFVVFLAWGAYELRVRDPLVDLRVNARPAVLLTNLASVAMGFALFASTIAFPQLLELPADAGGLGLPLLTAGLALMPSGFAMLAMAPVAGHLERRFGAKPSLVAGSSIIAGCYAASMALDLQLWHILLVNTLMGVGVGLGYSAMPTLIMQEVPRNETAAANGLNALMRGLGTATAAAAIATVLTSSGISHDESAVSLSERFDGAFALGLGAALAAAAIAAFIPRRRDPTRYSPPDAHPHIHSPAQLQKAPQ